MYRPRPGPPLNFDSGVAATNSTYSVLEGDEYASVWGYDMEPRFVYYKPKQVLLTATQWDHVNIYPTEELYIEAFKKLAKIYIAQKDYDNAAKWLSQMVFIEPNDLVLHDMLANCYIAKKEFPKAETEYSVAIALCRKMLEMEEDETNLKAIATLYSSRAEMYLLQGDKLKAISDANEALMKVPDFPKALEILKKPKP